MKPATLEPARLEFTAEGTPRSAQYDDIYHSTQGALAQARHVFVAGNRLPERFSGLRDETFVLFENGFGLGGNFLATVDAWRHTKARGRLHYLASEIHPLQATDFAQHLGQLTPQLPGLEPLLARLAAQWPLPLTGLHRLELADDLILTLCFGESLEQVDQLDWGSGIDAVFLDGFAPARNPAMWRPALLGAISRGCKPGATLATWCVAGDVRRVLAAAHWTLTRQPGFAGKREMLCGSYQPPHWAQRPRSSPLRAVAPAPSFGEREALVIGAGLAGCWVAARLAARGCRVSLFDRHPSPACGASGIPSALLRPRLARDDALPARLARAAYGYALRALADLPGGLVPSGGILHLAQDDRDAADQRECVERFAWPTEYVEWLDANRIATRFAGQPIRAQHGAWWFPAGRALIPSQVCTAVLAQAGPAVVLRMNTPVARLECHEGRWHALDEAGGVRGAAPHLVLATAMAASDLLPPDLMPELRLSALRGQLTEVDARKIPEIGHLQIPLCGDGHLTPPVAGICHVGASFGRDETDLAPRDTEQTDNLRKLSGLTGVALPADDLARDAWVGLRCMTQDRIPLAGPLPDVAQPVSGDPGFQSLPRVPGLHALLGLGARGLMWAPLLAELVACRIAGEPLPISRRMAEALDPGRFYLRHLRRKNA